MWIFSHSGINNVNIDVALEAKKLGMKVIAYGSAAAAKGKQTRHSSGKTIFDIADLVVDTCAPDWRRVRAAQESPGQGRAGLDDGVCHLRVDDGLHGGGDPGRARREALHPSLAQCAGRHDGQAAARRGAGGV